MLEKEIYLKSYEDKLKSGLIDATSREEVYALELLKDEIQFYADPDDLIDEQIDLYAARAIALPKRKKIYHTMIEALQKMHSGRSKSINELLNEE